MTKARPPIEAADYGRHHIAGEPLVFHCNYYNYWLQRTVTLNPQVPLQDVIIDAAAACAHTALSRAYTQHEIAADALDERRAIAQSVFSRLGFGMLDLGATNLEGGEVRVPVSHYGSGLRAATDAASAEPQSLFDAGYSAGAVAAIHGLGPWALRAQITACMSLGAAEGQIVLRPEVRNPEPPGAVGIGPHGATPPCDVHTESPIEEASVHAQLSKLDLSGNEEGLIPRFGVLLTNHFANFYGRISHEFVRRMDELGLRPAAEHLLVDAGHRCAFHTFGGVMSSAEWDAVVRPMCTDDASWAHGMIAVMNALGWGAWRLTELSPERAVARVYDDYESSSYLAMYGRGTFAPSYLAQGALAGLMNLVFVGDIQRRPTLDDAFYASVFESSRSFASRQTKSIAMGDPYTEVVAERRS